jgi:hypothetical protein
MPPVSVSGTSDVNVTNQLEIGNTESNPVPVSVINDGGSSQLYQGLFAATINPSSGTYVRVDIDDIPNDMRVVVESISFSLTECDSGLVSRIYIRTFKPTHAYFELPLLNNNRNILMPLCDDSMAVYQSNNFLTKFYLQNSTSAITLPHIILLGDPDLTDSPRANLLVTIVGYLEPIQE